MIEKTLEAYKRAMAGETVGEREIAALLTEVGKELDRRYVKGQDTGEMATLRDALLWLAARGC